MSIGDKVRATRKAAGISQEEVARRAGVSLNVINRLERGVILDPHYSTLRGIASALEVPVEDLVREPALARKAETPDPGSRDQPLISRPGEVWEWLLEQGHTTQVEFLSLAGEFERLEEVEGAIGELHETRDRLIEKLKDQSVQAALFGPPRLEGLVGDDRIREIFRPAKLAWQLEWEIRSEYLARETALVNYSRTLFVEGAAEDYLVRAPVDEHHHERHQRLLEARRVFEETYETLSAVVQRWRLTAFDAFVAERRIRALWELPWVLPATLVIGMTDEDLDLLYAARDKDEYWRLLRNIVERLEREAA